MNPPDKEHLIRRLACAIDADEPPGLSASNLARAVVSLVQDREAQTMVLLETEINRLAAHYPRNGFELTDD